MLDITERKLAEEKLIMEKEFTTRLMDNSPTGIAYVDKAGKFRFRLLAGNLQPILASEGYNTKAACKNGIASVKKNAGRRDRFVVSKAKNGKVYFNLVAGNKEVVGTSQMYKTRDTLRKGRDSVMKNAKSSIEEV